MQCTIALSDAQTDGNTCLLHLNHDSHANTKTYYIIQKNVYIGSICHASLWSAITRDTKEYAWPTNWWIIFMYFLEYWLKNVLFRQRVNSMQNQVQSNQPSDTRQPTGWCDQPVGHPWSISVFKLHLVLVRILNILPQVLCSQPFLKDSLSL